VAGTGLGWGLGRDAGGSPLAKEFKPFGLTDSLITAGSVAIAFKGYKWLDREPPMLCQGGFSGCSGTEDSLRGLDAQVRKHWVRSSFRGRALASSLSYLTVFSTLVLPSAFLVGSDQPAQGREFWLSVESGAITTALLQVVKHRVNRPRPYAHYCEPGCGDDLSERDTQLSFFSGHTALAFSFAVSAGTIASMRDYRNAGWVLGSGLTMAAATGYLRIAADRHYFTDVLVGAAVGAAVGWAVPRLHGTRDRPVDDSSVSGRRATSRPALALPVPLRGPEGGLWLQGAIGAEAKGVTLSWSF
jgi:membrane-associated phospholipid phosphatase